MFDSPFAGEDVGGDAADGAVVGKRIVDNGIGAYGYVVADDNGAKEFGSRADIDVVAQGGGAVVVADGG